VDFFSKRDIENNAKFKKIKKRWFLSLTENAKLIITKGSSRGATLSFTLRSKGEGGQPHYLIF